MTMLRSIYVITTRQPFQDAFLELQCVKHYERYIDILRM